MKKLSISLFALLAIFFSVLSAFSTGEKQTISAGWYLADCSVHASSAVLSKHNFETLFDPDFHDGPTVGVDDCLNDEDLICAAYFEEDQEIIDPVTSSLIVLGGRE
jgi:hypothetical protein